MGSGHVPPPAAQAKRGEARSGSAVYGWVRRSTAVPGNTAVRHDRSAKSFILRQGLEGFPPSVSSTRPRPSPTQRLGDKRHEDTTEIVGTERNSESRNPTRHRKRVRSVRTKKRALPFLHTYSRGTHLSATSGTGPEDIKLSPRMTDTGRDGHPGPSRHSSIRARPAYSSTKNPLKRNKTRP